MTDTIRGNRAHTIIIDDPNAPEPPGRREMVRRFFEEEMPRRLSDAGGVFVAPTFPPAPIEEARRWFTLNGADPTLLDQALSRGPLTVAEFNRLYCNYMDPSDDGPEDTRL